MMAPSNEVSAPPPAPVDMNDQGARGATDATDLKNATPDSRPSDDSNSAALPPSSGSLNEQ